MPTYGLDVERYDQVDGAPRGHPRRAEAGVNSRNGKNRTLSRVEHP
jgi:hypothetical protein